MYREYSTRFESDQISGWFSASRSSPGRHPDVFDHPFPMVNSPIHRLEKVGHDDISTLELTCFRGGFRRDLEWKNEVLHQPHHWFIHQRVEATGPFLVRQRGNVVILIRGSSHSWFSSAFSPGRCRGIFSTQSDVVVWVVWWDSRVTSIYRANMFNIWVNYNELTVLPHWKSQLVRGIIPKWLNYSG